MRKKYDINSIISYAALIVFSAAGLYPIAWMVTSSFKTKTEIETMALSWIPRPFTLQNYSGLFGIMPFARYLTNSLIIVSSTTTIVVILSIFAGYALARHDFRGKNIFSVLTLTLQTLPVMSLLIPIFLIDRILGFQNTYQGLMLPYTAFTLPFAIWMMRNSFKTIPPELDEAAIVDGCGRMSALFRVVLPLAAPGVAATTIFTFVSAWNEFIVALIVTNNMQSMTVPVGLFTLLSRFEIMWHYLMAGGVMLTIPMAIIFVVFQKQFISGLTAGAIKG